MILQVKQKLFKLLDSYDITDEYGNVVFTVKGKLAWGHTFLVYDAYGNEVGMLKEKIMSFLPRFEIYIHGYYVGCISKRFTFFIPKFDLDYKDWEIDGDILEWDYSVYDGQRKVMQVTKEIFRLSDTYQCYINDERDVLDAVMIALAIDAEKCSRN
ncbi:MAG: hypothetical protein E7509_05975 [Ruminococcus sp.]|nr:hypothetical protein [Ruminococcus sp.]